MIDTEWYLTWLLNCIFEIFKIFRTLIFFLMFLDDFEKLQINFKK